MNDDRGHAVHSFTTQLFATHHYSLRNQPLIVSWGLPVAEILYLEATQRIKVTGFSFNLSQIMVIEAIALK